MSGGANHRYHKAVADKRERLTELLSYVEAPVLLEMGCGSGLVMEIARQMFPRGMIVGLDRDPERLKAASGHGVTVRCDIVDPCLVEESVSTVTLVSTMHEVYSARGAPGVERVLDMAFRLLIPGGRLVIYDYVRSIPEPVTVKFHQPDIIERFVRFAEEFAGRRIDHNREGVNIITDTAGAVEFVRFCRPMTEEAWREEIQETNLFWDKYEFESAASAAGFELIEERLWREQVTLPDSMLVDTPLFREWIGMIVGKI